jgi:hypothetical protein
LIQCKSQSYTPYDYQGPSIRIGTGGGYTGQVREYCLLSNGQVFFGTNKEGFVNELESLSRDEVDQIFKNYSQLAFSELKIDKPGNMYHYLIYKDGKGEHKIQWGAHDANPPRELSIYFANLKKQFNQKGQLKYTNEH